MQNPSARYKDMPTVIIYMVLTAIFVCAFSACRNKPEHADVYQKALSLMDTLPDEAYKLLADIHSEEINTDEDLAYYRLYRALAEDKIYASTSEDSILTCSMITTDMLNHSIDYFESISDSASIQQAHYLKGRILFDKCDYPNSILSLLLSEEYINRNTSDFQKGLLYQSLSEGYAQNLNGSMAIEYANKAVSYYSASNKPLHTVYAQLNYADDLLNTGNFSDALNAYSDIIHKSHEIKDNHLECEAIDGMARSYLGLADYQEAVHLFRSLNKFDYTKSEQTTLLWAMAERHIGNINFADSVGRILIDNEFPWAIECFDFNTADRGILQRAYILKDENSEASLYLIKNNPLLSNLQKNHILDRKIREYKHKQHIRYIFAISTFVLLTLIIIIFAIILRYKQLKLKSYEIIRLASSLENSVHTLNRQIFILKTSNHVLEDQALKLITSRTTILSSLIRYDNESSTDSKLRKKIKNEIEIIISELRSDSNTFKELESCLASIYPNTISHIKDLIPSLSDDEYRLYILINAKMPLEIISMVFRVSQRAISTRKSRLKEKIKNTIPLNHEHFLNNF